MRPGDIELLTTPVTPALRDDLLLVALSRPDLATNSYRSTLRRVTPDGDTPWTHGERDTAPTISPDGNWVAFLRATGKSGRLAKPQLHVMPAGGGEARRLTGLPLGAGAPVWAPDSRRIAFTARVPEAGRYGAPLEGAGEDEAPDPGEEAPRRITRYDYRVDDLGYLRDRPQRLFVVDLDVEPGELAPVTDDRTDVSDPAWLPDGSALLVSAPRDWDRVETMHTDLYRVGVRGGEPSLAVRSEGTASMPVVADDGTVFFLGTEFEGFDTAGRNEGVWAATLGAEPARPRRLTDAETVDCSPRTGVEPVLRGDDVLVVVRNRGSDELRAVPRDADNAVLADLPLLAGDKAAVRGVAVSGDTVAVVQAGPSDAGEVLLLTGGAGGALKRCTDFSAPLRESGDLRQCEELTATAPDGYPVHGWLVLPEGEGPHPVLLVVHGGPFAQYEWSLFDEAQVYASAGYAVVLGNPRGSAGYGQAHGRAVVGGFGTVDVDDLLALFDAAAARPDVDAGRAGVMGGSYGGFMTGWLASHHGERFVAAWSERACNAFDSFTGSSDIGWEFTTCYIGDDIEEQRKRSPLTYAENITIPFAIVHSEEDWRCPIEQAQRMFVALKQGGTETEMLVFPGEGHELSRSGRPRHRVQRFEAVLDWWERHLGKP